MQTFQLGESEILDVEIYLGNPFINQHTNGFAFFFLAGGRVLPRTIAASVWAPRSRLRSPCVSGALVIIEHVNIALVLEILSAKLKLPEEDSTGMQSRYRLNTFPRVFGVSCNSARCYRLYQAPMSEHAGVTTSRDNGTAERPGAPQG